MTKSEEKQLKQMLKKLNSTLKYYDKGYISVKRSPVNEKERVSSLEQFVECRLNMECFSVPFLAPYAEAFDGHLFELVSLEGADEVRNRFDKATVEICKTPVYYIGQKTFSESSVELEDVLGFNKFTFNYSKRLIIIENE